MTPTSQIALIHGPPGTGKTHLAGTLIPQYLEAFKANKPHTPTVKVDNVHWFMFDRAGLDTLRAFGVEPSFDDLSFPPTAMVDLFSGKPFRDVDADMQKARNAWLRRVVQIIRQRREEAKAGKFQLVVTDTATALANMLADSYLAIELIAEKADRFDKRAAYGQANLSFATILNELQGIQCPQVWLCHSRSTYVDPEEDDTGAQKKQAEASRGGRSDIDLGFTPKLREVIAGKPSLIFGAKITSENNVMKYHLITKPDGRYFVKNRWASRMPADSSPNLRVVWDIITAAAAESADDNTTKG